MKKILLMISAVSLGVQEVNGSNVVVDLSEPIYATVKKPLAPPLPVRQYNQPVSAVVPVKPAEVTYMDPKNLQFSSPNGPKVVTAALPGNGTPFPSASTLAGSPTPYAQLPPKPATLIQGVQKPPSVTIQPTHDALAQASTVSKSVNGVSAVAQPGGQSNTGAATQSVKPPLPPKPKIKNGAIVISGQKNNFVEKDQSDKNIRNKLADQIGSKKAATVMVNAKIIAGSAVTGVGNVIKTGASNFANNTKRTVGNIHNVVKGVIAGAVVGAGKGNSLVKNIKEGVRIGFNYKLPSVKETIAIRRTYATTEVAAAKAANAAKITAKPGPALHNPAGRK